MGEAGRTSWEQGCEASRSVCGSPGPHWHCVRCLFLLLQTLVTVYTVPAGDGTGPASTAVAPELPHYPWSQGPLDPGELEFWTSWSPHTGPGGPAILGLTRHPPPTHVVPPASHLPPTLINTDVLVSWSGLIPMVGGCPGGWASGSLLGTQALSSPWSCLTRIPSIADPHFLSPPGRSSPHFISPILCTCLLQSQRQPGWALDVQRGLRKPSPSQQSLAFKTIICLRTAGSHSVKS